MAGLWINATNWSEVECCVNVSVEWKRRVPAVAYPLYILSLTKMTQEVEGGFQMLSLTGARTLFAAGHSQLKCRSDQCTTENLSASPPVIFFSFLVTLRQGQWRWSHLRAHPLCRLHLLVDNGKRSENGDQWASTLIIWVCYGKTP